MPTLLKIAWRSIWRSRRRTLITVSAIAFALGIAVFFIAFSDGMYAQLTDDAVRMQAGHVTLEHRDFRDAPAVDLVVNDAPALRARLDRLPGVERTKLLVLGQGVARSGRGAVGVALMAVEPSVEAATSTLANKIVAGVFLADSDERKIVIGRDLAEQLEVAVGKKVVLVTNDASGELAEELVRIAGIFATGAEEIDGYVALVPLALSQRLYGLRFDQVTQIGIVVADADDRDEVMEAARALVGATPEVVVRPWEEVIPELAAYIRLDGGSNYVFQMILIFLSMFTIFNTILMSVLERTRELAVMLALGTPAWRLRAQILIESSLIALLGCGAGLVMGGVPGYAMQVYGFDASALFAEGMSVSGMALSTIIHARVTPELLVGMAGLVWAATVLMTLFALRRIRRIEVAAILR